MDVFSHALIEHLLGGVVAKHPTTNLRVPHQTVAAQLDAILASKVGNAVGIFPVELALTGLGGLGLHVVLGSH